MPKSIAVISVGITNDVATTNRFAYRVTADHEDLVETITSGCKEVQVLVAYPTCRALCLQQPTQARNQLC